jgi:gliding motility-associated-like protein
VTLANSTGAALTQTYTLTVTSAAGCLSTGTVAVTVNPAVVPGAISSSQTICAGSVPAPLASAAPASGGTGAYTYQWEASGDNATWHAIANATGLGYAPGALTATTYFRRRAVGACGVVHTSAVAVQVQPLLVPTVALPALPAQCAGTAFTFTPVSTNAGASPTYQWLVNGVSVGVGPAYTSSALADGDQVQVVLTPTAGFCASGTATATARVSLTPTPAPTLTIVAQTAMPVCAGTPIRFSLGQATALGTNPQYQWQVDGVSVAGATSSVFTSTALRNGQAVTLVLRTTNACGQPATATSGAVRVVLSPSVRLSAGPNKTIMEGESVELEGTADSSYPVVWTPAATLATGSTPLRPKASPAFTTTYTLSAGAGYCADPSTVTVTVTRRIRIPNAFSPNADNNDDTWQIEGIEDYPANHVLIVNRWGGKIFEASGYSRAIEWKGTINGEPAPIGTYYYVLTLGNGKSYTGPLTIVH